MLTINKRINLQKMEAHISCLTLIMIFHYILYTVYIEFSKKRKSLLSVSNEQKRKIRNKSLLLRMQGEKRNQNLM